MQTQRQQKITNYEKSIEKKRRNTVESSFAVLMEVGKSGLERSNHTHTDAQEYTTTKLKIPTKRSLKKKEHNKRERERQAKNRLPHTHAIQRDLGKFL